MLPFIELLPRMAAGQPGAEEKFIEIWHDYLRLHDFY